MFVLRTISYSLHKMERVWPTHSKAKGRMELPEKAPEQKTHSRELSAKKEKRRVCDS
jgi:hypothetical protein